MDVPFPTMTVLEFLNFMKPALPMSREKPCTKENPAPFPSGSELRRWCRDNSVVVNGRRVKADEIIEFPVTELVFFPKSAKARCTMF